MVVAQQLDYPIKTDKVELASFLPVDSYDELTVAMPLAILLAFPSPITVFSLVHGFGLSLTLVFEKDCPNSLLTGGMACCEVDQLPRHLWLAASELVDDVGAS